jgi:quinol monooxygenase YgiN
MAIGVVVTLKVAAGKEGDCEAAFRELTAQVRANEPGNRSYGLFKSKTDPSAYVVMEVYEDQAAVDAHNATPYFLAAMPKIGATLAGQPDVRFYDSI